MAKDATTSLDTGQRPMTPPKVEPMAPGREINGYPFTTFADLSDFLGIIPRVSSDDLAYHVDFH